MNPRSLLFAPFTLLVVPALLAQADRMPPTPPPVYQALPPASATPLPADGGQRVYGPSGETLIARQSAAGILEGFRKAYVAEAAPRVVIYVNRALIDTATGLKLTGRDRCGTRCSSALADQKSAVALLEDNPGHRLVGDQAAKDREALGKIADVAVEVLISSRSLTVPEVSGDKTYTVPDIQATAIRLKDSAIIGQASASDILGHDMQAGNVARHFGVRDITEATALALMSDMLTGKK